MPLLALRGIAKSYAGPVLSGVTLELRKGEVHALLGANGAGKSTLAKIVAGLVAADRGAMELEGSAYAPGSKAEAESAGVQIVQQELNVIGTLSVAENLFLSRLPRRYGVIDRASLEGKARDALAALGLELDPQTPAAGLGVGVQQLVEIAGALARRARVLVLDEPTAALTEPQVDVLFENVRRLAEGGVGILYISHRLEEMRRIADRATVLRDGNVVLSEDYSRLAPEEIVRAMAGRDVERESVHRERELGGAALRVEKLSSGMRVRDVSFDVRHGEIFGLAGLVGSGRTSLLRAIFGADRADGGGVAVGESGPRRFRSPADAARAGLAMIPEDRKRDGLLLPRSTALNVLLSVVGDLGRFAGWLKPEAEAQVATRALDGAQVRRASLDQPVSELSGGNQQKVVVARWLLRDADVFLFDEPTRGIDVSSRANIYHLLNELAGAGKAIVIVSSDLDELTSICDRIGVLSAGRLAAVLERGEWSREKITSAAFSGYRGTT